MGQGNKKDYVLRSEEIIEAFENSYGEEGAKFSSVETAQKFASHFDESFGEALAKTYFDEGVHQETLENEIIGEQLGSQYGEKFGRLFGASLGETLGVQFSQLFAKKGVEKLEKKK